MTAWDGKERRHNPMDLELRDKITETHTDVKHLVKSFDQHILDDLKQWKRIDDIKLKIATWTGIGTGAGTVLGFIINKIFFH